MGIFNRDQKLNCLRDECQELNVRESLLRTFPLLCVRGRTFTHGGATITKRPSPFSGTLLSTEHMSPSLQLSCIGKERTVA